MVSENSRRFRSGIAEVINNPGLVNVDFADVKTVMSEMGMAMMGTGYAKGENRARKAAEKAISSPLLDDINLAGARLAREVAGDDGGVFADEPLAGDGEGTETVRDGEASGLKKRECAAAGADENKASAGGV